MRTLRTIDPGKCKAQDLRNIILFAGFSVIGAINPLDTHALRVRRVWGLCIYVARLLRLPRREFASFTEAGIKIVCRTLLQAWITTFGIRSCVYNIHVAICHVLDVSLSIIFAVNPVNFHPL